LHIDFSPRVVRKGLPGLLEFPIHSQSVRFQQVRFWLKLLTCFPARVSLTLTPPWRKKGRRKQISHVQEVRGGVGAFMGYTIVFACLLTGQQYIPILQTA
jgi:hypothetical protein